MRNYPRLGVFGAIGFLGFGLALLWATAARMRSFSAASLMTSPSEMSTGPGLLGFKASVEESMRIAKL